jgi:hypothetical protein
VTPPESSRIENRRTIPSSGRRRHRVQPALLKSSARIRYTQPDRSEGIAMKKHEVLALLEELPDEFDAGRFLYVLTLRHSLERAEADFAAGEFTSQPGEAPTLWEQRRARHKRTIEVLERVAQNREEWTRRIAASEEARSRGEQYGVPFRQIREEERRRRGGS